MRLESENNAVFPQLNLYNFEEDEYVGSKYVLTSPRSLEACDMLSVKPMELIYKPLSDFQDEMLQRGLTFQDAYTAYDHYEKGRQGRLRECRDYRDKMIRDQVFNGDGLDRAAEEEDLGPFYDPPLADVNGYAAYSPTTEAPYTSHRLTQGSAYSPNTEAPYTSHRLTQGFTTANGNTGSGSHSPIMDLNSDANKSEAWRTHSPYSERHLSKHIRGTSAGRLSSQRNMDIKRYPSEKAEVPAVNGHERLADSHGTAGEPPIHYKSQFMRRKLGVGGNDAPLNKRRELASSLPLYTDDAYKSSYVYHRRSYTTDGVGTGLARTSTPYDQSAVRAKAMDRSFTSISDIYPTSPREDPVIHSRLPPSRRRTNSAHVNLERETATLRRINGDVRGSRYENRGDANMSRSLSLTDLGHLADINSYHPRSSNGRLHNRGYTSDEEYGSRHRLKSKQDDTDEILSRVLERRQREIEEDLRREELEYRHHVDRLQNHFTDMGVNETRLQPQVDGVADKLAPEQMRRYESDGVLPTEYGYPQPQRSSHQHSFPRQRYADTVYSDEILADRTQRERRVELARELAVQELEAARVKSQQSRLQSERVRRAFREALSRNEKRWRRRELVNGHQEVDDLDSSYDHMQAAIPESSVRTYRHTHLDGSDKRYMDGTRHSGRSRVNGEGSRPDGGSPRPDGMRGSYVAEEQSLADTKRPTPDLVHTPQCLSPHYPYQLDNLGPEVVGDADEDFRTPPHTPSYENGDFEQPEVRANGNLKQTNGNHPDEHVRRSKKSTNRSTKHSKEPVRLRQADQGLVEDRVKELRSALEERRKKLNEKLKQTDMQTQELRAARLEVERKERDRRQQRANRRILKNSVDNKKTTTPSPSTAPKGRITEQVRRMKTTPRTRTTSSRDERDTFDKKVLKAELNNWVTTGHRTQQRSRSRSANRNQSQFSLA